MIMEQEVFEKMVLEFNELIKRVEACRDFLLDQEKVSKLDPLNRDLLVTQFRAMETYVSLLSIRIGYNSKPGEPVADTEETVTPETVND
jgi:hypothetical protein